VAKRDEPVLRRGSILDVLEDDARVEALEFKQLDDVLPFLNALAEGQSRMDAYQTAKIDGVLIKGWERTLPWFAELVMICEEVGGDYLEHEAQRRAVKGIEEPVFYQGAEVARITKYSDQLLLRLLEGRKPERYKNRTEIGGKAGAPLIVKIEGDDKGHL